MLVIYSHPNRDGHNGYILNSVENFLCSKKIKYEILDLYRMDYDPRLGAEELYTSGYRSVSRQNKNIQIKIKKSKHFVFIYPTWWNSPPAILKGFCERVFIPGFAFDYKFGLPRGRLRGRSVIFNTSGGPDLFSKSWLFNPSVSLIAKNLLWFCGIKAKGYEINNCRKITEGKKRKIDKMVKKGMSWLVK